MKGSSDIKGSLWNHLDKKVILWQSEAPLFLRMKLIIQWPTRHIKILHIKIKVLFFGGGFGYKNEFIDCN